MHTVTLKSLIRKLNEAELENILLRDPHSRSKRLHQLSLPGTAGTSGYFIHSATTDISLLRCIRIINETDLGTFVSDSKSCVGEGRFGKCYLRYLGHYEVCVKVFKIHSNNSLANEANILSKFAHPNLPYLFGVCVGAHPSIVTSYHGYNSKPLTLHQALFKQTQLEVKWMRILVQIISAIDKLHNSYRVLHNNLKGDNIVLTTSVVKGLLGAVVIDFGKACEIKNGQTYHLSEDQKELYKLNHPHIAPDLRDGRCKQSPASDIYSLGRIMSIITKKAILKDDHLIKSSSDCMQYDSSLRPNIGSLKESITL